MAARWAGQNKAVQLKEPCTADEANFWKEIVTSAANVTTTSGEIVNRNTHTTLKFTGVPTHINGYSTEEQVIDILLDHPKWGDVRLMEPHIFTNKENLVSTLLVKIADKLAATFIHKRLLDFYAVISNSPLFDDDPNLIYLGLNERIRGAETLHFINVCNDNNTNTLPRIIQGLSEHP